MKKIITVLMVLMALMVLMVATSMFARTKVLFNNIAEECVVYTDTGWKKIGKDFQNKPIEEVLDYFNLSVKFIEEYELTLSKYNIEQLDKYAEKYNVYYVCDYNYNWFRYIVKLNDKEQLEINYNIKTK